ncbi:hypothetical protein ZIOFF_027587 [Zingiber officinale]|uniref:Ribosome maturation protein SBDS n=1 Tax=Zingiber officinale TaxID=94328 RepID=A0A8J5GN48_ZINOF|nr:hypothetical protein ZIOFF_027587 [Zingiber officinale]
MLILEKGDLQVAGKERESQLSSQFRDIATIVMQKTINPEIHHPYTISMIERLMHEIHFAVDPNQSSKKQALEVIRELQNHFPIKRSPMRLRLVVPEKSFSTLMEKLSDWNANITSKDESGNEPSIVCELEPGRFRDCDAMMRSLQGRLEILAVSVHTEGDAHVSQYDTEEFISSSSKELDAVREVARSSKKFLQGIVADKNRPSRSDATPVMLHWEMLGNIENTSNLTGTSTT